MAGRYASGDRAMGICDRCGQAAPLASLIFDEQYPNLRVHAECWDMKHPQERLLPVSDNTALWQPRPEQYPYTAPVLEVAQASAGAPVVLTWSAAASSVFQFNGYLVYRAIGDDEYTQIDDLPIERDDYGAPIDEPLTYQDDEDFGDATEVSYYVMAYAGLTSTEPSPGRIEALSNIDAVAWEPTPPAVLSAPTPSGTIAESDEATIGATTDQASGTLYVVVGTGTELDGITFAQILAGQQANGSAAAFSGNAAVASLSPSVLITGLAADTAYTYAIAQQNANGDSNIVGGTFTTDTGITLPVLTDPTPTGAILRPESATLGATTNQASGTFYVVINTYPEAFDGITAGMIIAGEDVDGPSPWSGNSAVADLSPEVDFPNEFTEQTQFWYAMVQVNANGTSNVLTDTFTTSDGEPLPAGAVMLLHFDSTGSASSVTYANLFLDSFTPANVFNSSTDTAPSPSTQGSISKFLNAARFPPSAIGTQPYIPDASLQFSMYDKTQYSVECWAYLDAARTSGGIALFHYFVYLDGVSLQYQIVLNVFRDGADMRLRMMEGDATAPVWYNAGITFPIGQWVHCCMCRDDTTMRLFQDGVLVATSSPSGTFPGTLNEEVIYIANDTGSDGTSDLYLDEMVVCVDAAPYTAEFTPYIFPYSPPEI